MANYKKIIEKRHREDEATAFAFQEFIDTFQNVAPVSKTFIKSGVYNAGKSEEIDDGKGKLYNPAPLVKIQSQDTSKRAIECARLLKDNKFERSRNSPKPKTNLELLKEELRLRHLDRDVRHKQKKCEVDPGNAENVDSTTNLFLTNLSPKLNEQDLMQIFGVYGPLASVKIMWPRAEDCVRNSNVGFVAFMSKKDSEKAYANLVNRDDMRVSWGKPIGIPLQPIYIPPELVKMMLPPPYTGLPFNAQPLKKNYQFPESDKEMKKLLYNSIVQVTIPLDKKLLMVIHRVIECVVREGPMFEAMIMHKEINNPTFQFLFDNKCSTHVYYRWKLFSIMNGDGRSIWSTKQFRMFKGGSIWIPPTVPDYTKGMPDSKPVKNDLGSLSDNQQYRLIQNLQHLTISRKKVVEAMVFCLKHADASKDVVNILCESFENPETTAVKKVARLYLVSDILHNTKFKKGALKTYQELFEARLTTIFGHLEVAYRNLSDKNAFRTRVLKVLRAWEMWRIYPSDFIDKLESTVFGENCEDSGNDEPLDGKILLTRSLNYNPQCVVQPEVTVIKVEATPEKEPDIFSNFIKSKWETLDPAEIESQAMSTKKLYDIEMARIESERKQKEKALEYEELLRVELKVLKYQDELESGRRKIKKRKSLEENVNEYRRKCIEKSKRESKIIETSPISTDSFSSDDSMELKKKRRKKKEHGKSRKYRH